MEQADIDRLRQHSIAPQKMLIDGVLRASRSEEVMDVISPIDGRVFTSIARGTRADADEAVAAARRVTRPAHGATCRRWRAGPCC